MDHVFQGGRTGVTGHHGGGSSGPPGLAGEIKRVGLLLKVAQVALYRVLYVFRLRQVRVGFGLAIRGPRVP